MNQAYTYKDFLRMENMNGTFKQLGWTIKALRMCSDTLKDNEYTPPIPMDFETLLYLRRN